MYNNACVPNAVFESQHEKAEDASTLALAALQRCCSCMYVTELLRTRGHTHIYIYTHTDTRVCCACYRKTRVEAAAVILHEDNVEIGKRRPEMQQGQLYGPQAKRTRHLALCPVQGSEAQA